MAVHVQRLSQSDIQRIQCLHNWGIHITASIGKFDHVSEHRSKFHWLTVSSLIKYRYFCAPHKIYHGDGIVLDSQIAFGTSHTYCTQTDLFNRYYANCHKLKSYLGTWSLTGGTIFQMISFFSDKFPSTL